MSDCESAKAASAASFARFYFHNLRKKRPAQLAAVRHGEDRTDYLHWVLAKQADGSGTAVRHSRCTLLRHIKTAQQRVDRPHRAATTKASKYSRALRKLRRVRHPGQDGRRACQTPPNTRLEIIPLSLCGRQFDCRHVAGYALIASARRVLASTTLFGGCCVWTRLTLAL